MFPFHPGMETSLIFQCSGDERECLRYHHQQWGDRKKQRESITMPRELLQWLFRQRCAAKLFLRNIPSALLFFSFAAYQHHHPSTS